MSARLDGGLQRPLAGVLSGIFAGGATQSAGMHRRPNGVPGAAAALGAPNAGGLHHGLLNASTDLSGTSAARRAGRQRAFQEEVMTSRVDRLGVALAALIVVSSPAGAQKGQKYA